MFSFRGVTQLVLLGTTMSMSLACGGEDDVLLRVGNELPESAVVEIDTQVDHEALTATVFVDPNTALDITVANLEDEQIIRVTNGWDVLFQQRLAYDGKIREIQTVDATFSTTADNSLVVPAGSAFEQYFEDCHNRRILCHIDAAEALRGVQKANPEAFAQVTAENAGIGFRALTAPQVIKLPTPFPLWPRAQKPFLSPSVQLEVK